MKILNHYLEYLQPAQVQTPPTEGLILTIGNFDGVHLGHQALLSRVFEYAKETGNKSLVVTFDPHPLQVLRPETKIYRLFDREDQIQQFKKLELDYLLIQPFSRDLSQLSPEQFVKEILLEALNVKGIIVGYDFSFGAHRAGNIQTLNELSKKYHFHSEAVNPLTIDGEIVSSSLIRDSIAQGKMEKAAQRLGRNYYLKGLVEKGDARGKKIGFPTANLHHVGLFLPRKGVYVTRTLIGNKYWPSITNVGTNPTFTKTNITHVETHIFDFDKNIYGEEIQVELCQWIRDENKFNSKEELQLQIQKDILLAKEYHKINKS